MTDETKSMHQPNTTKDARPQVGETSSNPSKSPVTGKPAHGDPDHRSIGDEKDRGLRQDTQSAGSRDRSADDRSSTKEKDGKSQPSGSPGMRTDDQRKPEGERSAPGKDGQTKRSDPPPDRSSK